MCEFRYVKGHIEVYLNGEFWFSADTMEEAYDEIKICSPTGGAYE